MTDARKEFQSFARPLAQGLIDYAQAQGKDNGLTDVRITVSASEKLQNAVEKGAISSAQFGQSSHVTVTLYAGARTLSFTRNCDDVEAIKHAIRENLSVIHMVPENAVKAPLAPEKVYKGAKADLDLYDTTAPADAELVKYVKDFEKAALAQEGVKTARSVSITKETSHRLILATNGVDLEDSKTMYYAGASVIAEDANGMQVEYEGSYARHFGDMQDATELGQLAGKGAVAKLSPALPDTGVMPVVLNHDAAESFFRAVHGAISGGAVHRGATMFKGKVGQQVMAAEVTMVDDPSVKRGASSVSVDVAGVKAEPVTFIENGVLKTYSVNLTESRQLGVEPMGREQGATNSSILPGKLSTDELIKDIKDGIYIKGFNGGTLDTNTGLHSRQAYGLLIKDGKITDKAVAGFVVSGNLKEMFMNVVLANDTPKHPGKHSLAAPTTRINGVTIAGK